MAAAKADRLGWLLYDFANNSFSVMIVTFVYPVYFKSVVCAGLENLGDLLWGINGSASLVVVALRSPVLGAVGFGYLADRIGPRRSLILLLSLWVFVGLGAAAATSKDFFWAVASLGALCLASVGAVSRSMIALMVEPSQQAEIFGFYGISGKFSSAVGPLLFGLVSHLSGSQRLAMLAASLLFITGLALLMRVEEPSPGRVVWR